MIFISIGGSGIAAFMSVYADLVRPCVNTSADHCLSTGLISKETYHTIIVRHDLNIVDKARILLSSIHCAILEKAKSLDVFVDVLTKVGGFESLVHEIGENGISQVTISYGACKDLILVRTVQLKPIKKSSFVRKIGL